MGRRRALSASAWATAPVASSHCSLEKRAAIAASDAPIAPTTAATDPPPGAEVSAEMVSQNSPTLWLEKSNGAAILVDVDVEGRRGGAVARHRLHVPEERHEPARARVLADVADGDGEAGWCVQERRVVRERQVRLRHADRELVEADLVVALDRLLRGGEEYDAVGAVHALADRLDLGVDRLVELVDRLEVGRWLGRRDDGFRERRGALAAALEGLVQLGGHRAALEGEALDRVHFLVGVARKAVDRDDGVQAELLHDPEVALHVGPAALDGVDSAVGVVAVMFERTRGRHEDDGVRAQLADAADDVEELLHAHV